MSIKTSHSQYAPFAEDVVTAPLRSVSLDKLEQGDNAESQAFFEASRSLGFFYLDMTQSDLGRSIIEESERLKAIGEEWFKLPKSEKDEYRQAKIDPFFAYRPIDTPMMDDDGTPRRNESYNIRKDDLVGNCEPFPVHPQLWKEKDLMRSYSLHCRQVIDLMFKHLDKHLQLPPGTLYNLHRIDHRSGDHLRFNRTAIAEFNEERAKGGEHTDFGALTVLINWLGGLQIRHPETNQWVYVKPVPGSAVINLGDALVLFTSGILRSNIHRVVPPPPPQDGQTRFSLVYFSRPEDKVLLQRLKGGLIDAQPVSKQAIQPMTSQEWINRRSLGDLRGVFTHAGGFELRPSYTT